MRTDLGKPAPLHLRRLFLPSGSCLRLRRPEASLAVSEISQRPPNMWRYSEFLPLPQSYQPRFPVGFTPLFRPHPGEADWTPPRQSVHQERCGLPTHFELQRSRRRRSALPGASFWLRHGLVFVDGKSGERRRRTCRARRPQGMDLHPVRSRARKDSRDKRFRREGRAHRR